MEKQKDNKKIENIFDYNLKKEDQEWIDNNIPYIINNTTAVANTKDNVNLSENVNDTCKNDKNSTSTKCKNDVILELKKCSHKTSPRSVASLLKKLFSNSQTKENHWLFVAQHWPPRTINRVIAKMIKQHQRGDYTINNPAAYFTYLIKFRRKRKIFTNSIGIR